MRSQQVVLALRVQTNPHRPYQYRNIERPYHLTDSSQVGSGLEAGVEVYPVIVDFVKVDQEIYLAPLLHPLLIDLIEIGIMVIIWIIIAVISCMTAIAHWRKIRKVILRQRAAATGDAAHVRQPIPWTLLRTRLNIWTVVHTIPRLSLRAQAIPQEASAQRVPKLNTWLHLAMRQPSCWVPPVLPIAHSARVTHPLHSGSHASMATTSSSP